MRCESELKLLKQDVLDLQKRSIQYNILKREVDTNRELYTSLLQRYKEVDVASGVGANKYSSSTRLSYQVLRPRRAYLVR